MSTYTAKQLADVAAAADTSGLSDFDGRPVSRSRIEVTNAGDGLSAAMAVRPEELHHGQEVVLVIHGTVSKVGFRPAEEKEPDGPLARIHTIRAGTATILGPEHTDALERALRDQEERILRAVEAAAGISRLPGVDDGPATSTTDHDTDPIEEL